MNVASDTYTPAGGPGPLPPEAPSARLTPVQANTIYAGAYQLSQKGRYEQAAALFALLSLYEPQEAKYALAMAICYRKLARYKEAVVHFARAWELDRTNFGPAFQLIECMLLLGQREEATELLELMSTLAEFRGDEKMAERVSGMLELLQAAAQ